MSPRAPSFGSQDYWDQRFTTHTTPFDWLSAPDALDPFITEALNAIDQPQPRILHIGCGSSLLSQHLKTHVQEAHQVHNVDYSTVVIDAEKKRDWDQVIGEEEHVHAPMRWDAVDLLSLSSLLSVCKLGAYSVVVDKSTSDAVSCADDVTVPLPCRISTTSESTSGNEIEVKSEEIAVNPLRLMAVHLALVTEPGARWISLSYTSDRYPFLEGEAAENGTADADMPDPRLLWTVVGKHQIEAKERGDGSDDGVTHRPKVYHCVHVLQRTNTQLFIH